MTDSESARRCQGLSRSGGRELTHEECLALIARWRPLRWYAIFALLVMPVLAAMLYPFVFPFLNRNAENSTLGLVALAVYGILFLSYGPVAGLLIARDYWRVFRAMRPDVESGTVDVYSGGMEESRREIEVFPTSDYLYRVDGQIVEQWIPASTWEVAADAHEHLSVPIPAEMLMDPSRAGEGLRQRHMTDAERREMDNHIRQAFYLPRQLLLMYAFGLFILGMNVVRRFPQPQWSIVDDVIIALFCFFVVKLVIGINDRWKRRSRWKEDLALGRIAVLSSDIEGVPIVRERLPVSGMLWSGDGKPAAWRVYLSTRKVE